MATITEKTDVIPGKSIRRAPYPKAPDMTIISHKNASGGESRDNSRALKGVENPHVQPLVDGLINHRAFADLAIIE